jgi:putative transposase
LRAIYTEAAVAVVAKELADARKSGNQSHVEEIFARYTYRMHNLSEFMKALLIRFTRWFNKRHERSGTLWEERFKSVIVESGIAARTMAAYIDLNPVRAGMAEDPAEYRWSSYGEAVGGGPRGNGKKAREGLVRACMSHEGCGFEAEKWAEVSRVYRRMMMYAMQRKGGAARVMVDDLEGKEEEGRLKSALHFGGMLRHRVRYFTDGAVIGSKVFVNEAFAAARERFTRKRKDGARRLRGNGKPAAGVLWSMRDLRVRIT